MPELPCRDKETPLIWVPPEPGWGGIRNPGVGEGVYTGERKFSPNPGLGFAHGGAEQNRK